MLKTEAAVSIMVYLSPPISFVGAFTKLQKETVSFVMSVRPDETTRLPLDGFS
jgi:hypothetical protein